ncbi:rubber elongation factor protein (REF) [Striga asiatica]|uniref:Rubber elongation factor protein (REF) n=1 Tax=Striga asiatica TaxID=4170 RepID=A0A5A7R315_STRAF|nr:rubber elongation factor protein (REF) [Striga asiatica]
MQQKEASKMDKISSKSTSVKTNSKHITHAIEMSSEYKICFRSSPKAVLPGQAAQYQLMQSPSKRYSKIRHSGVNSVIAKMIKLGECVKGDDEEQSLKYLEFVQAAALHTVMFAARLYDYAKERSGPLKPGVDDNLETNTEHLWLTAFHFISFHFIFMQQKEASKMDQINSKSTSVKTNSKHITHAIEMSSEYKICFRSPPKAVLPAQYQLMQSPSKRYSKIRHSKWSEFCDC